MKYVVIGLTTLILLALGWATTAGLIWLICLCFKWSFDLLIATGVWLALLLLRGCFHKSK